MLLTVILDGRTFFVDGSLKKCRREVCPRWLVLFIALYSIPVLSQSPVCGSIAPASAAFVQAEPSRFVLTNGACSGCEAKLGENGNRGTNDASHEFVPRGNDANDIHGSSHFDDSGSPDKSPPSGSTPREVSKIQPAIVSSQRPIAPDFNREIYYRNKREFSQEVGWLPMNIPFPFDFMLNSDYNTYPLKYTLMPMISTLRWHLDRVKGPLIIRGNWELDASGAVVGIPRGPETRYFAWIMGMRRNFVPRNWKATPYLDWRIGMGNIDAKGPLGVPYAQGQDFTFTLNMGSGVRYNFNSKYAVTAGLNWMHISNANLSEGPKYHWGIRNYGINVYGPMIGIVVRLGRPKYATTSK